VGRLPGAAGLLTAVALAHPRWEAWRTFERFTEQARLVVVESQVQARSLRHNYIGTEHLLLGLLAEPDRPPVGVLRARGVELQIARECLTSIVPAGEEEASGQIPFTPRAKKTLELAVRECLSTGHRMITPEHLLLGLLSQGDGVATQILRALGVDLDDLRSAVVESLPPPGESEPRVRVLRGRRGREVAPANLELGFLLEPSPEVRRLLMSAGARALDDGRTEISIADVEEALRRRGGSAEPPHASTG